MNPITAVTSLVGSAAGGIWLYVGCAVVGAAAGGFATHKVDANYYGAQIAEGRVQLAAEKTAHIADLKAVSDTATKAANDALLTQQNWQHHLAALDTRHALEKRDAQAQNDKLRADVAAGRVRLRIAVTRAAVRAASGSTVPTTPGTAGVDDGTALELAPVARRAYFDLRAGIAADHEQILGLQDYIRTVCQPPAAAQ